MIRDGRRIGAAQIVPIEVGATEVLAVEYETSRFLQTGARVDDPVESSRCVATVEV